MVISMEGLMFGGSKRRHKADPENPRSKAGLEAWIVQRGWKMWWQNDGTLKVSKAGKDLYANESTTLRTLFEAQALIRDWEMEQIREQQRWAE